MNITLNGNLYELREGSGVNRSPMVEWPENTRLDGQQQRKDRRLLSSWVIDSWRGGLGRKEINAAIPNDLVSLWDAENVDTRIDGQVVLSPAFNTCTIVPSRADVDLAFEFLNNIYFAETQRAVATNIFGNGNGTLSLPYTYQFSAPLTLGSFRQLGYTAITAETGSNNVAIGSLRGIISRPNLLGGIIWGGMNATSPQENRWFTLGTLGGLITATAIGSTTGLGAEAINRLAQLADLGGTIHIIENRANNRVGFWIANQTGALLSTPVASLSTVIGSYLSPLVTDGITMFTQLPEGVYDFDLTPAVVISTQRAQDKNGAQVMFNNDLYFKNKYSLMKYDGADITSAGYDTKDGLASDKMGEITAMVSSWKNIYAAVRGATYTHILSREINGSWQYYARVPSPGLWVREMFLSDSPDAIDRLWLIYGNYGYPGYFLNPMVNPLQAATYSYVPTGYFRPPVYGGDLPEENGAFFDQIITGDALGGGNLIDCFYGLEGATPTTSLGRIASTTQGLTYGSPYGLQGFRIQPQFMLAASATGTTPVFRQAIIHYLKKPDQRETFGFEVDLEKTVKSRVRSLEEIIGSLTYESNSKVLMPFWYGQIATRQVLVTNMPGSEKTPADNIFQGERKGFIQVQVAEIL